MIQTESKRCFLFLNPAQQETNDVLSQFENEIFIIFIGKAFFMIQE
jgi:hypothetical protein